MTDRIERQLQLHAPISRVWRAISDKTEFGQWFGVRFPSGHFVAGETVTGNITYPGYEHVVMTIELDRVEPEQFLSYRWHPYAIDPQVDYSGEATTLVSFALDEKDGGTLLTIVESGFDAIPAARRDVAWRMNDSGWAEQIVNIERHVSPSV
jgi:uncharacterized protein YndB with AHSA1/START domain